MHLHTNTTTARLSDTSVAACPEDNAQEGHSSGGRSLFFREVHWTPVWTAAPQLPKLSPILPHAFDLLCTAWLTCCRPARQDDTSTLNSFSMSSPRGVQAQPPRSLSMRWSSKRSVLPRVPSSHGAAASIDGFRQREQEKRRKLIHNLHPSMQMLGASMQKGLQTKRQLGWRQRVYLNIERPHGSRGGMVLLAVVLLCVFASILSYFISSLPGMQQHPALVATEWVCTLVFTVELVVRGNGGTLERSHTPPLHRHACSSMHACAAGLP